MASTTLSTCSNTPSSLSAEAALKVGQARRLRIMAWVAMVAAVVFPPSAFALEVSGLCDFALFLKNVATGAAIIALVLFVLNSFFMKSSVVGDIIMYVIIGCVIVAVAPDVVALTGLTTSCSF